jgi:hypothetical protein
MKLSFYIFFTFIVNTVAFAEEDLFELNAENLTTLALKNSSDEVLNEYALHTIKTKKTKEYYKFRNDNNMLKQIIKQERKLLDESLEYLPNKAKYIYKINTNYLSYDDKTSTINLGNQFAGTKQTVFRSHDSINGLPNYFLLLIPNIEIQNSIKVIKSNFDRRQKYLRKISQIRNKEVYVEFILSIEKYQNQHDFQVVIEEFRIYTSANKKSLLGSKFETRNHKDIINNWLLSDGITNPLVGIHAFQFSHNRLQDQLSTNSNMSHFCKKTKRIKIHQVVVCTKHFSQNTDLIINYLGGKVAQIDLVARNDITKSEIRRIQTSIKNYLKLPKLNIEYNVAKWSDYNADFTLFSDAFNHKTSKRSTYKSIFEKQQTNHKRTIILTMMAHKTQELLNSLGVNL